jgi:hypothetical protein
MLLLLVTPATAQEIPANPGPFNIPGVPVATDAVEVPTPPKAASYEGMVITTEDYSQISGVENIEVYAAAGVILIKKGQEGDVEIIPVAVVKVVTHPKSHTIVKVTDKKRNPLEYKIIDKKEEAEKVTTSYLLSTPGENWFEIIDFVYQEWETIIVTVEETVIQQLVLSASSSSISEGSGTDGKVARVALSNITRIDDSQMSGDMVVSLRTASADITIPASVTIKDGQVGAIFKISANQDTIENGNRTAMIFAEARGAKPAQMVITIVDDDGQPDVPPDEFDNIGQRVAVWTVGASKNREVGTVYKEVADEFRTRTDWTHNDAMAIINQRVNAIPGYNPAEYTEFKAGVNADIVTRWPMARGVLADYWTRIARGLGVE